MRWLRHPVVAVTLVAAAVRLLVLVDLPLVITNDGVTYLEWGRHVLAGRFDTIPPVRTPGYPVFLAGVFATMGVGGFGVLVAQLAMGVGTSAVMAWALLKRGGAPWALGLGTVAAVSPSLMLWECYALTETPAVFLVVSAFAVAVCARVRVGWGVVLGVALGLMCLVRPSIQILVPFVALGWMWRGWKARGPACGAVGLAVVVIGIGVTTGPWLVHNSQRGVYGLARGGMVTLWWGMAMNDALDRSYPLPPSIRGAADRLPRGRATDEQAWIFVAESGALDSAQAEREVSAWARASVFSRPRAYLRGVARAFKSQLEMRGGTGSDTGWFLWRLSRDGREMGQAAANFQVSGPNQVPGEFGMEAGRGWSARAADWLARHKMGGVPRLVLFVGAIVAGVAMLRQRRWGEAVVIAGTGALFMVHAAILLPHSRYGVTACACWIVLMPDAVRAVREVVRRFRSRCSA